MGLPSPGQSSSCGRLKALPGPVNLQYLPLRHVTVNTSLEESLPKPCIPKHLCIEWLLGSEVATTFWSPEGWNVASEAAVVFLVGCRFKVTAAHLVKPPSHLSQLPLCQSSAPALWWIGDLCRLELQEEMLHHQSPCSSILLGNNAF